MIPHAWEQQLASSPQLVLQHLIPQSKIWFVGGTWSKFVTGLEASQTIMHVALDFKKADGSNLDGYTNQ